MSASGIVRHPPSSPDKSGEAVERWTAKTGLAQFSSPAQGPGRQANRPQMMVVFMGGTVDVVMVEEFTKATEHMASCWMMPREFLTPYSS